MPKKGERGGVEEGEPSCAEGERKVSGGGGIKEKLKERKRRWMHNTVPGARRAPTVTRTVTARRRKAPGIKKIQARGGKRCSF